MEDSYSEQLDANTKLFITIRQAIPVKAKLKLIRRLFNKFPTPNVNECDSNYGGNTPLHMAVKRNEIEVIKFLIAKNADTSITNKNGLTPLSFAKRHQCPQIVNYLKYITNDKLNVQDVTDKVEAIRPSQSIQFISEQQIKEFNCNDRSQWCCTDAIGDSKILKVNSSTVEEALTLIQDKLFVEVFNKSTHLFVLIINVEDCNDVSSVTKSIEYIMKLLQNAFYKRKPVIVQWHDHIIFRESHKPFELFKSDWRNSLTEEELIEELTPDDSFRFPLLLKALHFNFGGSFNGNLLDTSFDVDCEFDTWRFIDYAARSDDALSLRFLLLVKWNLSSKNGDDRRVLEIAAEYASPQSISALLNLSTTYQPEELLPSCWQRNLLAQKNCNGHTPLVITALNGKNKSLNFLINCGIRQDYEIAIHLAWSNQCYANVLLLLMMEAPFPNGFELNALQENAIVGKLRKFTKDREDFHKAIEENSQDIVRQFMIDYPHLKHAFNPKNQSAVITALNANEYDMLAILQMNGFCHGKNEEWNLNDEQKRQLKEAKSKHFKNQYNSHIAFLLSKCRLAHEGNYFDEINILLEQLDVVPNISTVLKVLEHSNIQEIIFDFGRDSIIGMDPTQNGPGFCDYAAGTVFIAAKQTIDILLETLANELVCFAVQTVYNNGGNPFSAGDEKTRDDFKQIIDQTRGKIPTIDHVFTNYPNSDDWPSELIARICQLFIRYRKKQEYLAEIKRTAPEIFSFYHRRVQGEFKKFLQRPSYFKNQHLNDLLQQLDEIQRYEIRLTPRCLLDIVNSDDNLILTGPLPQLTKVYLYQYLQTQGSISFIKGHYIFTAANHFKNQGMVLKIRNSFKSELVQTLVVDCTSEYDSARKLLWATIKSFSKQPRLIFIADSFQGQKVLEEIEKPMILINKTYEWTDFDTAFQNRLLAQEVDFQGYSIPLNQLIDVDSYCAKSLPFINMIQGKPLSIGKPLPISYGYDEFYFIERTLTDTRKNSHYASSRHSKLLQMVQSEKVLLLVDGAGMGKSTLLTHFSMRMKQQDPSLWVIRFDLKEHTAAFEKLKRRTYKKIIATEFLSDELLKLESITEKQIFAERLRERKVIVMFDGVDEICPRYKDIFFNLLIDLKYSGIQQLWVTTRLNIGGHFLQELRPILCKLQPITITDQITFLTKFWRKSLNTSSYDDKIKSFAVNLIRKISKSIQDKDRKLIGIPLQARMLAEVYEQDLVKFCQSNSKIPQLPRQMNLLEIYEKFVHGKYLVYIFEKNNLSKINIAREDLGNILAGGVNLRKVHQQLALRVLFPDDKEELLKFHKKHVRNREELNRIGIVEYVSGRLSFIHQTFCDYYASDFFIHQLSKCTLSLTVVDFFLKTILLSKYYGVIRSFINNLVIKLEISNEILMQYGRRLDTLWKTGLLQDSDKPTTILHRAVREGNTNIVKFLSKCLMTANCFDTTRELFETYDQHGKSIWVISAENGYVHTLNAVWTIYKEICRNDPLQLKQLLISCSTSKQTTWMLAVALNQMEIFGNLLEYAKEIQLGSEQFVNLMLLKDNNEFCLWYQAALKGQAWVFKKLLIFANRMGYDAIIFRELLLIAEPSHNESVWDFAALGKSAGVFKILREWAKEAEFSCIDFKEILHRKNDLGETIWHKTASEIHSALPILTNDTKTSGELEYNHPIILKELWNLTKEANLSSDELKHMLLEENESGESMWHTAIENKNHMLANQLLTLIKEEDGKISKEFFRTLLLENNKTESLWWKAVRTCNISIFECFWKWICESDLSTDEIKNIITEKEQGGRTAWHFIVASADVEMLNNLWRYVEKSKLTINELRTILYERDNEDLNVWEIAIESNDMKSFNNLLTLAEKFNPTSREFKELLLRKRRCGNTTWHVILARGYFAILNKLLQLVENQNCKEIIMSKNKDGETAFHLSAKLKKQHIFDILLKWTKKAQMNRYQIEELLAVKDKRKATALVWAVNTKNCEVALDLLRSGSDVEELNAKQCSILLSFMRARNKRTSNEFPLALVEAQMNRHPKRCTGKSNMPTRGNRGRTFTYGNPKFTKRGETKRVHRVP